MLLILHVSLGTLAIKAAEVGKDSAITSHPSVKAELEKGMFFPHCSPLECTVADTDWGPLRRLQIQGRSSGRG